MLLREIEIMRNPLSMYDRESGKLIDVNGVFNLNDYLY